MVRGGRVLNPEKYQNAATGQAASFAPTKFVTPPAPLPTAQPTTARATSATPPMPPLGKSGIERPSLAQVKSQIESQFKKDAEGNFADIEGVYKKLGELAEKYNDSAINDLIYYDESSGKFLWK